MKNTPRAFAYRSIMGLKCLRSIPHRHAEAAEVRTAVHHALALVEEDALGGADVDVLLYVVAADLHPKDAVLVKVSLHHQLAGLVAACELIVDARRCDRLAHRHAVVDRVHDDLGD